MLVKIVYLLMLSLLGFGYIHAQDTTSLAKRVDAERVARQLKLQGFLEEQPDGTISPVDEVVGTEDSERLKSLCDDLNRLRRALFDQNADAVTSYIKRIHEQDLQEVNGKTGKVVLRVGCPLSLSQKLLPSLLREYLVGVENWRNLGVLVWDRQQRYFGSITDSQKACIALKVDSSSELKRLMMVGDLDLVVNYGDSIGATPDESVIAWDGLAIIVHPQSSITRVRATSPGSFGSITWLQVTKELDCRIPGIAATPSKTERLASFDAVEDRVFRDRECAAVVPLGVATFTDNKLIRVATDSFPSGYYPTQLTVARKLYPWTRPIILLRNGSPSHQADALAAFLAGEAAKQTILNAGYALKN